MFSLRPLAKRFVTVRIGNGRDTSFWFDKWTPFGPLITMFGPRGPRDIAFPIQSRVSHAANHEGWKLRPARSPEAESLQIYLTSISLPMPEKVEDVNEWQIEGSTSSTFSSNLIWNSIRSSDSVKSWFHFVWYKGSIPK